MTTTSTYRRVSNFSIAFIRYLIIGFCTHYTEQRTHITHTRPSTTGRKDRLKKIFGVRSPLCSVCQGSGNRAIVKREPLCVSSNRDGLICNDRKILRSLSPFSPWHEGFSYIMYYYVLLLCADDECATNYRMRNPPFVYDIGV